MNKLFIFFALTIMLSFVATAQEDLVDKGVFQKNERLNLLFDCAFDGVPCSTSASCNVSRLEYPNASTMFINRVLSQTFYPSWNTSVSDTSVLGTYTGNVICCQGSLCGSRSFFYQITPTGKLLEEGESTISLIITAGVFILAIIFFILAKLTKGMAFKMIFYGFSLLLGVGGFLLINGLAQNYIANNEALVVSVDRITLLVTTIMIGGGLLFGVYLIWVTFSYLKQRMVTGVEDD